MITRTLHRSTLLPALAVVFTACGGGSGGGSPDATGTDDAIAADSAGAADAEVENDDAAVVDTGAADTAVGDTAIGDTAIADTMEVDTAEAPEDTWVADTSSPEDTAATVCVDPATDCPATGTACRLAFCTPDGACETALGERGATCADGGGTVCDGGGACVACLGAEDCAHGDCVDGACEAQDNGLDCAVDEDCSSGHCVDQICCDTACEGTCQACTAERTGGETGTCGDVIAGQDAPAGQCQASLDDPCGNTGACASGGVCALAGTDVACGGSATCTDNGCQDLNGWYFPACDSATLVGPGTCDGAGTCVQATTGCGTGYLCTSDGQACETDCLSGAECTKTYYCPTDLSNPTAYQHCVPRKAALQPCTLKDECLSNSCNYATVPPRCN